MSALHLCLLAVNVLALLLCIADKARARKRLWRIPERVLLTLALLGGAAGLLLGMLLFRHKTKHPGFAWGVPVMLICQLLLVCLL